MTKNNKVSIILPTYNGKKYIRDSIESIINQTYTNWELIIVNDCSTDDTQKIIEEYQQKDKRIIVINNEKNLKLPASLNRGFEEASGEYYTWTSDDNLYKPNALQVMTEYLDANNSIDLVSAVIDFIDENTKIIGNLNDWFKTRTFEDLYKTNNIMACFMYRRSVAEKVGEYDTTIFTAEDYDYWCRIALNGYIGYINDNLYSYRFHGASLTSTKFDVALEKAEEVKLKYIIPLLNKSKFSTIKKIKLVIQRYKETKNKEYLNKAKSINIFLYLCYRFNKFIYNYTEEDYKKVYNICGIKFKFKNISKQISMLFEEQKENISLLQDINRQNSIVALQNFNYLANLQRACVLHQKTFQKYKNINQGKDVVLIATGPSLIDFKPIGGAINVGVNKAFQYKKVKFDYLFLQDYSGMTQTYIEDFCNYDARKFLGFIPDYISGAMSCIIPEKYSNYPDVERYYVAHPTEKKNFTYDIATQPLGDAYSIAFPAMQFILWTNPKRIYLVGCDCNMGGYHDSSDKNNLAVNEVIDGWKRMKEFAETYYPDTEIISINPVGLKGVFKDEFTEK